MTREELCASGRVTPEELDILDTLGLVLRREADSYPASSWNRINRALRLRRGLEADWEMVALIMDLLHQIEELKARIHHLEAAQTYRDFSPGGENEDL